MVKSFFEPLCFLPWKKNIITLLKDGFQSLLPTLKNSLILCMMSLLCGFMSTINWIQRDTELYVTFFPIAVLMEQLCLVWPSRINFFLWRSSVQRVLPAWEKQLFSCSKCQRNPREGSKNDSNYRWLKKQQIRIFYGWSQQMHDILSIRSYLQAIPVLMTRVATRIPYAHCRTGYDNELLQQQEMVNLNYGINY